jgi:hypothetical protein
MLLLSRAIFGLCDSPRVADSWRQRARIIEGKSAADGNSWRNVRRLASAAARLRICDGSLSRAGNERRNRLDRIRRTGACICRSEDAQRNKGEFRTPRGSRHSGKAETRGPNGAAISRRASSRGNLLALRRSRQREPRGPVSDRAIAQGRFLHCWLTQCSQESCEFLRGKRQGVKYNFVRRLARKQARRMSGCLI